jgi:tetratricopeptide (TPR) repeat protein
MKNLRLHQAIRSFLLCACLASAEHSYAEFVAEYGQVNSLTDRPVLHVRMPYQTDSGLIEPERMAIAVTVHGYLAETSVTLTFRNDSNRILEGYMLFAVPANAIVNGYGLEVNGETVPGIIQERATARMILETEMRRAIDPGILEWVQGSIYRTRVYPLPARGARTFTISWVAPLGYQAKRSTGEPAYYLPVSLSRTPAKLSVRMECVGTGEAYFESYGQIGLYFKTQGDVATAAFEATGVDFYDVISVRFPKLVTRTVWAERSADGQYYFTLHPSTPVAKPNQTRKLQTLRVLWDASHSRDGANRDLDIALVENLIKRLAPERLAVLIFRNKPETEIVFNEPVNQATEITALLSSVVYDGGSDIAGAIAAAAAPADSLGELPSEDIAVLFSDGCATLNDDELQLPSYAVFPIAASDSANTALLREVARVSGGRYLDSAGQIPDAIVEAISAAPFALNGVDVAVSEADEIRIHPGVATRSPELVTGRLLGETAAITLSYGYGRQRQETINYVVRKREARDPGNIIRTFWASSGLARLSAYPLRNAAAVLDFAGRYGIATPSASFLALETGAQYAKYGIEPPGGIARLEAEYRVAADAQASARARLAEANRAGRDRDLKVWLAARASWNARTFDPPPAADPTQASLPLKPETKMRYTGGCFLAGTVVATAAGPAAIESVAAGTFVYAYDFSKSEWALRKVLQPLTHPYVGDVVRLAVNNETIMATGNHPFWVVSGKALAARPVPADLSATDVRMTAQGRWVEARDIIAGDLLQPLAGEPLRVDAISVSESATLVYNLTVEELHTYAVGGSGILVHNKGQRQAEPADAAAGGDAEADSGTIVIRQAETMRSFYIRFIEKFKDEDPYSAYLALKDLVIGSGSADPALYFETAQWFLDNGDRELGLRVLTNIAEAWPDAPELLRMLAYRLEKAGEYRLAEYFLRRAITLQPNQTQQYRSLALLYERDGRYAEGLAQYTTMLEINRWGSMRQDLEQELPIAGEPSIAATDFARLLDKSISYAQTDPAATEAPSWARKQEYDIRVVLSWSENASWDIGLAVQEPSGEYASHMNVRTRAGGSLIPDYMDYGMEEYAIADAAPGRYVISSLNTLEKPRNTGPILVRALVYLDFGRPGERMEEIWKFLPNGEKIAELATVEWDK